MDGEEERRRRRAKEEQSYGGFNFNTLSNLTQLSPATQRHLQHVYGNLTVTTAMGALAAYLGNMGYLGQPGLLAMLAMFGGVLMIALTRNTSPTMAMVRHGALFTSGFGQGWLASPLINYAARVDPNSVLLTLVMTVLIFGSFTASAFFSPRRQYLYLGGLLGSLLLVLMGGGLINSFLGSAAVDTSLLYLGLGVFAFYILYDTQVIVERAEASERPDAVLHAYTLFTDLAAIFIRLLVLFTKDKQPDRRRQRKN